MSNKRLIAFSLYGGKTSKLGWLLPLIPYGKKYIDAFGGSASVLLNRAPSEFEVYNDLDGQMTNFFTQLRNNRDELLGQLALTQHNRREFEKALRYDGDDAIELARLFYVKIQQGFMSSPNPTSLGDWRRTSREVRRGFNQMVSRWLSSIDGLVPVVERLRTVSIENRHAFDVIKFYDSEDAVIYCDPTYLHETRKSKKKYSHELTDEEHIEMASILNRCKGKIAISGYWSELYKTLFEDEGWSVHFGNVQKVSGFENTERQEVLWTNYEIGETTTDQTTL